MLYVKQTVIFLMFLNISAHAQDSIVGGLPKLSGFVSEDSTSLSKNPQNAGGSVTPFDSGAGSSGGGSSGSGSNGSGSPTVDKQAGGNQTNSGTAQEEGGTKPSEPDKGDEDEPIVYTPPTNIFENLGSNSPPPNGQVQFSVVSIKGHPTLADGIYRLKYNLIVWFCPKDPSTMHMMDAAYLNPNPVGYFVKGMIKNNTNNFELSSSSGENGVINGGILTSDISPVSGDHAAAGPAMDFSSAPWIQWMALNIRADARGDGTEAGFACLRGKVK